ncbi:MAG: hypothetical protein ACRD3O_06270 [Terriglobia bacterium]
MATDDHFTAINDEIRRALNEPGLADQHQRLNSDEGTRLLRKSCPMVLTLEFGNENDLDPIVPPPGTVVLFSAPKGSRLLRELESALTTRSTGRLRELGSEIRDIVSRREVISVRSVVDKLIDAPVYSDLRYGGKTLAQSLALVNGLELGSITFAYNGGRLNDNDFQIVDYYRPGAREELDYLIVKHPPHLSKLERAVVEAVPENMSELNLAIFGRCRGWTIIAVVAFVVLTAVGQACLAATEQLANVKLSPEQYQRLGGMASARELVNMRRQILETRL